MKLKERRKEAIKQLESELTLGTKPTKLSAVDARKEGLKKYNGKFREPLTTRDIRAKRQQINILTERIK